MWWISLLNLMPYLQAKTPADANVSGCFEILLLEKP